MKSSVLGRVLVGALVCLTATAAVAQAEKTLTGTVVEVDGGTLIMKMDSGEIRSFTPPAERRFLIDGKELTVGQLQPGTKLTATYKEATTTVQTVDTLEGTVAYAAGTTVILTLPTNERRQYNIKSGDPVKFFDYAGKEITVFDLKKNMRIKATRITEAPRTEIASATVTGTAPAKAAAAAAPAPKPAAPAQAAAAPAPKPAAPAQAQTAAAAPPPAAPAPATLPKTASPLPLLGLVGILSLVAGLGLTAWRRSGI